MEIREIVVKRGDFKGIVEAVMASDSDTTILFGEDNGDVINGHTLYPPGDTKVVCLWELRGRSGSSRMSQIIADLLSQGKVFITKKTRNSGFIKWSISGKDGDFRKAF